MIAHRRIGLTLPFLCSKTVLRLHEVTSILRQDLKAASEQRRLLLTEIGNTKTLKETIVLITDYLQTIFSLSKHEVIQSFSRSDVQRLIVGSQ